MDVLREGSDMPVNLPRKTVRASGERKDDKRHPMLDYHDYRWHKQPCNHCEDEDA